jgi:hypothetical protein
MPAIKNQQAQEAAAGIEEVEQEPEFDPRALLSVLTKKVPKLDEAGNPECDDNSDPIMVAVPLCPGDLPQNVETTVPTIVFAFHAIRLAKSQVSARPAFGAVLGLTGILNLFALSIGLSLGGWMFAAVYAVAFIVWDIVATMILKAKLLSPALTIRKDAYGRRYYWLEKWWKWEAVKFHDGIKQDYKGTRLIYLDASEDVVRVFNAYAAPLPRLDLDPSDTEFDVTTESLADLPSMMKDVKAWVKDEEPNREVFIRQGLLAAVLGGCLFAIYWAWLSLQDVLEA